MTKRKKTDQINEGIQADNIKADVIAVGRNARAVQYQNVGEGKDTATLDALVAQLNKALAQVPKAHEVDAEAVAELTQEVLDKIKEEKPNRRTIEIKTESLRKAAETLADIAPTVLTIATQIVSHVIKTVG